MSGIETIFIASAGCICFNTVVTQIPKWYQWLHRWIRYRRTMYISKHANHGCFLQICNVLHHINKRKVEKSKNASEAAEYDPLMQHIDYYTYKSYYNDGQIRDNTISKNFTVYAPGTFIDIQDYDITIEVLGSSSGIDTFAIHEHRQWGKEKYICIERFLISLGDIVDPSFQMPVVISDVLKAYIDLYGLKLGEDHSKTHNPQRVKQLDVPADEKKVEEKKVEEKKVEEKKVEEKKDKSVPGPQNAPAIGRSPPPAPVKLKPVVVANAAANAAEDGNKTDDEDYDKKPLLEKNNDSQ